MVTGLRLVQQPYPHAWPDVISVRQTRDLFTASLKFHLAMPLAVQLYTSHYLGVSGRYYGLLRLLIPLLKKFRMRAYILSYILVVI